MNKKKTNKFQNIKLLIKKVSPKKIIAVTKKQNIESVEAALYNQIYKIGENQIQEAEKKFLKFKQRQKVELHFIGKLQSNKIKKAVNLFDVIQTVDTKKQIKKIGFCAKEINKKQKIYLQINISQDPKKGGIKEKEVEEFCSFIKKEKNIKLCGVMTILKKNLSKTAVFNYYEKTKKIQTKIFKKTKTCKEVSMGMTNDYNLALKAGATEIRLGTALFGKRKQ